MKLVVIINDCGMAANLGGLVQTYAKEFPMPAEVAQFIEARIFSKYVAAHLAIEYEEGKEPRHD